MKAKKLITWIAVAAIAVSAAGCGAQQTGGETAAENVQEGAAAVPGEASGTAEEDLSLSRYEETVTVRMGGKMNPNAKLPEGMTYEDNTYLDMLKEDDDR